MPGDGERDLAVGVPQVGLGDHLINVAGYVGCEGGELWGVVKHDGVGHDSRVVHLSKIQHLTSWRDVSLSHLDQNVISERVDIKFLPDVTLVTFLNGVRLVVVSFETSEDVPGPFTESDHSFIPGLIPVDVAAWRDRRDKCQALAEDGEIFLATKRREVL